jgi:hypothetical protein
VSRLGVKIILIKSKISNLLLFLVIEVLPNIQQAGLIDPTHKINLNDSIDKLFVLTENGCHSCNKKFSELVLENIMHIEKILSFRYFLSFV